MYSQTTFQIAVNRLHQLLHPDAGGASAKQGGFYVNEKIPGDELIN